MRKFISATLALAAAPLAHSQPPTVPQIQKPPVAAAVSPKGGQLTIGAVTCSGANVSMPVSTSYTYNAGGKTKAEVYIAVNGAATERFTVNLVKATGGNSTLSFSRTVTLPANRTDADLRIYVDGQAAGPVQTVPYSCITAAIQPTARVTAQVELPDLAVGSYAFVIPAPTRPATICERRAVDGMTWDNFWACGFMAPRLQVGSIYGGMDRPGVGPPGMSLQARLFQASRPNEVLRLDQAGTREFCPRESDAQVTVRFTIAILTTRLQDPKPFLGEGFWEDVYSGAAPAYRAGALYWDYRVTQTAPYERDMFLFPAGYEWIAFERRLPCTKTGEFSYTLDAAGQLTESNEGNNTIRFKYTTVPLE